MFLERILSKLLAKRLARLDAALQAAEHTLEKLNAGVPAKRIEEMEARLVDLVDRHEELARSHARLRSRDGMRDLRARRANGEDNHFNTPDEYREYLERKHGLRK